MIIQQKIFMRLKQILYNFQMKKLRTASIWFFISVNIFWLGLNMRNNAVGTVFMPYLVERFTAPEIRNTALGAMRTAGLVIAMLVQPAIGLLSDRSTSRFGRRRPYLLAGVILDVLLLIWIALAGNYWSLLAAVMIFQVTSNISHGALQGLIPDLVPEEQRGTASAIKAIFELLPVVILGITIAPLVGAGQFGWAVVATGATLVIILVITLFAVQETPQIEPVRSPLAPEMLRVLGMLGGIFAGAISGLVVGGAVGGLIWLVSRFFTTTDIARLAGIAIGGIMAMLVAVLGGTWAGVRLTIGGTPHDVTSFRWWVANRLMFLAAITSIQGFAPYFLMYTFQVSSEQAVAMTGQLFTVAGVFTLLSALPAGWLADRWGQKSLTALSGILAVAGTAILLVTVWQPALSLLYLAGTVLGLATGLFVTINWALGTRLVPVSESGRWLGVSNLAGAGAGMIGAGIGGALADTLNAGVPGLGYFTIFAGYGLLFLGSAACLLRITRRL
jgi:MFS family permease